MPHAKGKDCSNGDVLPTDLSKDLCDGSNLILDVILLYVLANAKGDVAISGEIDLFL